MVTYIFQLLLHIKGCKVRKKKCCEGHFLVLIEILHQYN